MTRLVEALWAVAVLGALGLPASAALARRPFDAALLVIPMASLTAATAGLVAVAARLALAPSLVVGLAATTVGALAWRRRGGPVGLNVNLRQLGLPAMLALAPLIALRGAPVDFDARSIWWFHARWLLEGGARAAANLSNPAFFPTSPDYPPLAPATVAAVWRVHGGSGDSLAQTTTAILTAAFVALLAAACLKAFRAKGEWIAIGAAAAVTGGLWGFGGTQASSGSVDVLVAAELGVAAVALLATDIDPTSLTLGLLGLIAAALTKNDGLSAAIAIGLLASGRLWKAQRRGAALVPAAALLPGLAWQVVAHANGAQSGVAKGGTFSLLLHLDPTTLHRTPTAAGHLLSACASVLIGAAVVMVAVALDPSRRARSALRRAGALAASAALVFSFAVVAYTVGNEPVLVYLSTSVNRVSITPRLLLLLASLVAASAVLPPGRSWRRPPG
jgi:hypothetical protein